MFGKKKKATCAEVVVLVFALGEGEGEEARVWISASEEIEAGGSKGCADAMSEQPT